MRLHKTIVALLAVMLAGVMMVPMASASESQTTTEIADKEVQAFLILHRI